MEFKQWLLKEDDKEKQLDKANQATIKPNVSVGELSRYSYLKKGMKKAN